VNSHRLEDKGGNPSGEAPVSNSVQITRNFLSLFISNVVGQLFTLWAFVRIAGVFGPEGFGRISFAQVVSLIFLYLADFGLQTLGTRTIAQEKGDIRGQVWSISLLRIALAAGCFVVLMIFSLILPRPPEVRTLILVFGIALFPSAVLLEWVFQGLELMKYVGLARVLKGMVFAGLVFLFIDSPDLLTEAAVFYVGGIVVAAGVLVGVYYRRFGLTWRNVDLPNLKKTLVMSAPLAAGSFISQLECNFGVFALGLFLSDETVGLFSAAYKIVLALWALAVTAAASAVFPLMARSYSTSMALFSHSLKKVLRLFALVAIPIGVGGFILASKIMGYLYPAEYQKAVIVFQLSIWMVAVVIYRAVFENAVIASKRQRNYWVGYVLAGTVTILGNLLLIPVWGFVVPSVIGVVAESTLLVYFAATCKFVRSSYLLHITVKPLIAGILMGVALLLLPLNLFVLLGIGIVTYFVALLILRAITLEELGSYVHSFVR